MLPVSAETVRVRACLQAIIDANEKLKLDCKVYCCLLQQITVRETATAFLQLSSSCAAVPNPALLLLPLADATDLFITEAAAPFPGGLTAD